MEMDPWPLLAVHNPCKDIPTFKTCVSFVSADEFLKDNWKVFNNHIYKYFKDSAITGTQAREACQKYGTQLVSINNPVESDYIEDMVLRGRYLSVFVGGSDLNDGKYV